MGLWGPCLFRRLGWWWVHAAQDPRKPVDTEFDLVAGVVVWRGIGRDILLHGHHRRRPRLRSPRWCLGWALRLPVDGNYDGAIEAVFRQHPDLAVGAIGHDREIRRVVVPLVDQFDAADRQGGIDRHRFGHWTMKASCVGAVLGGGPV